MATRMQQRRGTATEWSTINPILAAGEIGYETDTGKFKIGDGTNTWSALLAYGSLDAIIDAAPETLDTLNELAAAINDDPDFYNSISTSITDAVAQLNTSIATNRAEIEAGYAAADADEVTNRNSAITTAVAAEAAARDLKIAGDISAQASVTTTEIADAISDLTAEVTANEEAQSTTLLAYADGVASSAALDATAKADAAQLAAETTAALDATAKADAAQAAAEATAGTALTTHNADTTNVHGIADTSLLATTSDVSTAQTAAQTYADGLASNYDAAGSASAAQTAAEGFATGAVTDHNAETTSVHGIADTSDLALLSAAGQTFSGDITVAGNLTVSGTTVTVNASDLSVRDNMIYLNQAGLSTITGAVGDGTNVVYTTDADHGYAVGDYVTVTGVTPSSFDVNAGGLEITAVTATTFTVLSTNTDTYVSGGAARGKVHSNPDLGWAAGRYDDVNGAGYGHAGIFRDASDGIFKFFDGYIPEPDENVFIDTTDPSFALADLSVAALTADTVTPTNGIVFSDGTQVNVGVPSITPIAEKTASYTLSSTAERDTIVEVNSASATTLTIPADAVLDFPVGTTLDVIQTGAGQVTIAGAGGVTVNATPGLKLRTQWSSVTLLKRGADNWLVFGDTSA